MAKPKSKKRRKSARGPSGKSVASVVYDGLQKRHALTVADLHRTKTRLFATQQLLLGAVLKAGGRLELDDLPPDRKFTIMSTDRKGGVILELQEETPTE